MSDTEPAPASPEPSAFQARRLFDAGRAARSSSSDGEPVSNTACQPGLGAQPWQDMPGDLLGAVVARLAVADIKSSRLVCRDWHRAVSSNTLQLQPRTCKARQLTRSFPAVRSLDLKRCNKRLGDLDVVGLGRAFTVRVLSLDGCENITDAVLIEICKLPRLTHLNLRNCIKLTDVGVGVLAGAIPPESLWQPLWSPRSSKSAAGAGRLGDDSDDDSFPADGSFPASPPPALLASPIPRRGAIWSPPGRGPASPPGAAQDHAGEGSAAGADPAAPASPAYSAAWLSPRAATAAGAAAGRTPPPPPPLQSLDLSGCLLLSEKATAALGAGLARSLTSLQLGGCSRVSTVSDAMLEGVGRCTALRALDLSGCTQITDAGLSQLSCLRHLASLSLWNCLRISGVGLAALSLQLTCLTSLSLRGCQQLEDEALGGLRPLSLLRRLDVRACENLRGEEFDSLSRLSLLSELNLRGCYSLVDSGLEGVAELKPLRVLNLQECWQLTQRGLAHLSGLTALVDLNLQGCRNLMNDRGVPLVGLSALRSLTALTLRNCDRLADGALGCLSGLQSLKHLDITGCKQLSGGGLKCLTPLAPSLVSLRAQHCSGLRGPNALTALSCLTALTSLNLGGCVGLHGAALGALAPLGALRQLSLEGCRDVACLDEGLVALGLHPALTSISLQGCNTLGDKGLEALGLLTALAAINASDCSGITGTGLAAWAALAPTLTSLQLQNSANLGDEGLLALAAALMKGADSKEGMGKEASGQRVGSTSSSSSTGCSSSGGSNGGGSAALPGSQDSSQGSSTGGAEDGGSVGEAAAAAKARREPSLREPFPAVALRELNLKHCKTVTDVGLSAVATALGRLTALSLQGMVGITDDGLASLGLMRTLRDLELQFCWQFTDEGVSHLSALTCLTRLDLMYSWKITDAALGTLRGMTSLLSLNVLGCHRLTRGGKSSVVHLLDNSLDN